MTQDHLQHTGHAPAVGTEPDQAAAEQTAARRTVLRGVRLARPGRPPGAPVDLVLAGGVVVGTAPVGTTTDAHVEDLDGWLVTSALAEPHAHLDKALTADRVHNPTGDLAGAVAGWTAVGADERYHDLADRALRVLAWESAAGVTALRTHVDTGGVAGLGPTRTLVGLREQVAAQVSLQVFASFGLPVSGPDGAATRRTVDRALELGVDGLGGAPNLDDDPVAALDVVCDAARAAGVPLDLHLDETLDPDHFLLEHLARRAPGLGVPVTVDHCCSLALQPPGRRARTAAALADAGVTVVTLPQTNLYLQGRSRRSPVDRGLTAVRDLLDAGVTVAGGGDNVHDAFNAVGRADPLETASLLVAAAHLDPDQALTAVTDAARTALGLPAATLEPGSPADLLVTDATSVGALVGSAPAGRVVLKAGQVVARTCTTTALTHLVGAGTRMPGPGASA